MSLGEAPVRLVIISAGTSEPSTTRMLADRAAQRVADRLRETGRNTNMRVIEIGPLAVGIARALVTGLPEPEVQIAIQDVATADALIAATPVYKAGISGLFKAFADLLDNDLLIAKPVLLAATAGSARHAMVAEDHLRPLFAFFRALPTPTSLFAAPEDWADPALTARIDRAAIEMAALIDSSLGRRIEQGAWSGYQHTFGSNAARAEHQAGDVDLDTDLMQLARGGHHLEPGPGVTTRQAAESD
jgi:FMN reductase